MSTLTTLNGTPVPVLVMGRGGSATSSLLALKRLHTQQAFTIFLAARLPFNSQKHSLIFPNKIWVPAWQDSSCR